MEFVKEKVIPQCSGCKKVLEDNTCEAYISPKSKWRLGNCNLASHLVVKDTKTEGGYKPKKYGKKRRGR
jgi:hypothetical protein